MNKYIENFKQRTEKKIETLRAEAQEVHRDFIDTGYQRYYKKEERLPEYMLKRIGVEY